MVRGTANGDVVMWQLKKQSTVELRGAERGEKEESIQKSWGVRREMLRELQMVTW